MFRWFTLSIRAHARRGRPVARLIGIAGPKRARIFVADAVYFVLPALTLS